MYIVCMISYAYSISRADPGFCHRGGANYKMLVLCAERSEAPFQPGVLISSIFKRHSEAYAQSICIHTRSHDFCKILWPDVKQ